ncbi:hypothetical protein AVEN_210170-1 [Araneus ventricosus]|uniref:Uncharacterized protein n=1 Tax=Araneus ventricosus TaxID=182803 RepID=A0A4Y2BK71_ARAVE|nr:hypothetical protein AVEN_210170-1 [Araneus ventricosus]
MTRPYRTTAKQALNIFSGIPPLHLTAKMEFLKFQIWTCRTGGLIDNIEIPKLDLFVKLSDIPLDIRVLNIRDRIEKNKYKVYKDASKIDSGVGFSVCILKARAFLS